MGTLALHSSEVLAIPAIEAPMIRLVHHPLEPAVASRLVRVNGEVGPGGVGDSLIGALPQRFPAATQEPASVVS